MGFSSGKGRAARARARRPGLSSTLAAIGRRSSTTARDSQDGSGVASLSRRRQAVVQMEMDTKAVRMGRQKCGLVQTRDTKTLKKEQLLQSEEAKKNGPVSRRHGP